MTEPNAPTERGFTLVELMIALVIFSIAVAGILNVAVAMTQGIREQRQAVMAQDAVRSPLDYISDALRQSSPGVQDPTKVYDVNACTVGAITVTNSQTASDTLDVIFATGGLVTATRAAFTNGSTSLTVTPGTGTNFAVGDYVLVTNFSNGHLFQISAVAANTITVNTASCSGTSGFMGTYTYASGSLVIRAMHATFSVANDASNNNMPTLWMDPDGPAVGTASPGEPLAEGIEDMQLVVAIDADASGGVTENTPSAATDEFYYNNVSDAAPTSTAYRLMRVTMIARTKDAQHGDLKSYSKPASEDRTGASSADSYRRRILRTNIDLRNVTGSP
jgi:prepilin-type N-terminal cleavage/methylation domain-containing protein